MFLLTEVLQLRFGIDLADTLGLHYPQSDKFNAFQLVSHLFMHGSFFHIFFNMFSLWMFGNMLENLWGSKRFFIFYIVCGLGAAGIHLLFTGYEINKMREAIDVYASNPGIVDFKTLVTHYKGYADQELIDKINRVYSELFENPQSSLFQRESVDVAYQLLKNKMDIPTVGASGAVYGLLLAFGMIFPNTLLYLYLAIPIKAKYAVLIFGLIEVYMGFENSPGDNVAHFAHLGGMLFGFIMIKMWNKNRNRFY